MKLSSIVFAIAFAWCLTGCSDAGSDPSATTSDPSEAADASDASDTTDTSDATDASDQSDASDASDASATADASDASSDDSDTSDPSDASDSSDASEVADASDPSDTVTVTTLDDIRGLDLRGDVPRATIALPEFGATNSAGSSRGPPNIVGSPTVVWFFPAAGTYG